MAQTESMWKVRKICQQRKARPTTHCIWLDEKDSLEWAEKFYKMDHWGTRKKFDDCPNMTLDLFIKALKSGKYTELTFRGLQIMWFSDMTDVTPL